MPKALADQTEILNKCDKALQSCTKVVEAKNKELQLSNLALMQSIEKNKETSVELENTKSKLDSPFRNPFIMVPVGIILGLVLNKYVTK